MGHIEQRAAHEFVVHWAALIMASATLATNFRGKNIQVSDKYGLRGFLKPS